MHKITMKNKIQHICPCGSGENYLSCCSRYHKGMLPENALALMKSRYAAYAMQQADYIIKTTHPANPLYMQDVKAWKMHILQFSRSTEFRKLEILDFIDGDIEAFVTFTAHLIQNGQDVSFTEKSRFQKIGKQWLYKEGQKLIKP